VREALQGEHNLAPSFVWDLCAHQTGIAALRDDADTRLVRAFHDAGNLVSRAWPQDDRRSAVVAVTPFGEIGRHAFWVA
jgi:hypothetical protein